MRPAGAREPVITIDGPAGAGKTTAARALARRLGFRLLDTGAMYRAVAWSVTRAGLRPEDTPELERHLAALALEVVDERVRVDGLDVTDALRDPAIGELTSRLSALPAVRAAVVPLQRRLASAGGVVLEGRDTGTVVCPDADVKFYLDAALGERARRRHAELVGRGIPADLRAVTEEIRQRDAQDAARALAPLRKPEDAVVIDTTTLSVEQVVERMLKAIEERCCTRS